MSGPPTSPPVGPPTSPPTDPADTPPGGVAAPASRSIDTATAEALRRDAQEGRQLAAVAKQQKIEAAVDEAARRGAIAPSRKRYWVQAIQADPAMADVLAGFPDELAV